MKKFMMLFLILVFTLPAFASDEAGKISKYEGRVLLYDGVSPRPVNVTDIDTPIFINNKISTKKASMAILELLGGDRVALSEGSTMTIAGIEEFKPESGRVIFHIRKRGQTSGLKVALKTAVIGVKGTKFLIDWEDSGKYDVFLKEGKIECTPVEGQFKVYKDVVMDEYEAYVKQMTGEYDEYVKKLEEEFIEYVDSFIMEPGQAFSVEGKDVRKVEFTDEIDKAFNIFDETGTNMQSLQTPVKSKPQTEITETPEVNNSDFDDDFDKKDELDKEMDNY